MSELSSTLRRIFQAHTNSSGGGEPNVQSSHDEHDRIGREDQTVEPCPPVLAGTMSLRSRKDRYPRCLRTTTSLSAKSAFFRE
jgi:hypothetical protein